MADDGFATAPASTLLVLSGPCGTGKTSLALGLLAAVSEVGYTRSVTTRPPRPGEDHYDHVDRATFHAMIEEDAFAQWIRPSYDEYYGTLRAPVEQAIAEGRDLIFDYCPEGYLNLRRRYRAHVVGVFVMAPSLTEMTRRLEGRGTESAVEIKLRYQMALRDFNFVAEHDYHLVNHDLDASLAQLQAIYAAEKLRLSRQPDVLPRYARRAVPTLLRYYDPA